MFNNECDSFADNTLRSAKDIDVVFHFVSTMSPEIHFKRNDVKEPVFTFSSSVYEEPERIPVEEGVLMRPVSVYGMSNPKMRSIEAVKELSDN